MNIDEAVNQLEELKVWESDQEFIDEIILMLQEVDNLKKEVGRFMKQSNEAIRAVNQIYEIDNLKREVIFHMKRAQEAEMLLREVQPYCLQEDRNKISEFFRK